MLDFHTTLNPVAHAFEAVGGIGAAAKACGRSCQALSKWRKAGALPRTEYTGQTTYAKQLAKIASDRGNPLDVNWLLEAAAPAKSVP